jgi:hypothetical protein
MATADLRQFTARVQTESRQHTYAVEGASFEDAVFEFVDCRRPQADEAGEVAVLVTDSQTGEQHCFRLDLDSGEAERCP